MHNLDKPIIAIDFDGTIVEQGPNNYILDIFEFLPNAEEVLKYLQNRVYLILWTCRQGKELQKALKFLKENEITFDSINENLEALDFDTSNKIYADLYLDDKNGDGKDIDWLKFKKRVEKIMEQHKVKAVAAKIINKVSVFQRDRSRLRYKIKKRDVDKPFSNLKKDMEKAEGNIRDLWDKMQGTLQIDLKNNNRDSTEIEEFGNKVKRIVTKEGLPDNLNSVRWLDEKLKDITNHKWIIPMNSFNPGSRITIRAFNMGIKK